MLSVYISLYIMHQRLQELRVADLLYTIWQVLFLANEEYLPLDELTWHIIYTEKYIW